VKKVDILTIIGVGLIGGSIALAVRKKKLVKRIYGFFRRKSSFQRAIKRKIVDQGFLNLEESVKDADLVILATPILSIIDLGKEILKYIKKETIVTDVGSTKYKIVRILDREYSKKGFNFIGSHPLAGLEKKGCEWAEEGLFQNKLCILTPTSNSSSYCIKTITKFWEKIGSKVINLSPLEHDKIISRLSHLPHLLVFSLLNFLKEDDLKFSSPGFRDLTRIGSSDSAIWSEIFLSNKKNLLGNIDRYIKILKEYQFHIRHSSYEKLVKKIKKANLYRSQLLK
jgi:prephenate dehydrogenase